MASKGRTVGGVILIVLAVLAGVSGILNYIGGHPHHGLAFLIACGVLLILGVVLLVVKGRKSKT